MLRFLSYTFLAAAVMATDQASKWLIVRRFAEDEYSLRVTNFFNLVLVHNQGISFGLLNKAGAYAPMLLTVFATLVTLFLLIWLWRTKSRLQSFALALLIGGAVGNIVDRVIRGKVVDFLDFHWGAHHWPAFNVADMAVVAGVALLLLQGLVFDTKSRQQS